MKKRIERLQNWMREKKITALLIENPIDLFYLTGLKVSLGKLFVEEAKASLFVDGRYLQAAKKTKDLEVFKREDFSKKIKGVKQLYFDSSFLSYDQFLTYQKEFPSVEWKPFSKPVKDLRLFKDEEEIKLLKKAAEITYKGYEHLLSLLEEGISEKALALEFEIFCKKNGAEALSFEPIIAFGENSAYPHHRASEKKLKKGELIQFDLGAIFSHYAADMSRVYFFGEKNPKVLPLFEEVERVYKAVVSKAVPGVKIGALDQFVREEFKKSGRESLFVHALGHGIGLETHEFPRIKGDGVDQDLVLAPNMVITIEPGLYFEGVGGIRIEDTYLITDKGAESFY